MPLTQATHRPIFLLLLCLGALLSACQEESRPVDYSIDYARAHMQQNNWDSAKVHAVNVLAWAHDEKDISLANTIISMANDNLIIDEKELEEKWSKAFKDLRLSYEAQEDITWIYDPSTTQFTNKNSFHLYMGTRDRNFWLQFRVQYRGLREISMLGYTVNTEHSSYTFSPNEEIHMDRKGRLVWEWFDQKFTKNEAAMIEDVIRSDTASLILIGSKGNFERMITEAEKTALRNILEAFKVTPGYLEGSAQKKVLP